MMSMMFAVEEQNGFLRSIQLPLANARCPAIVSLIGFEDASMVTLCNTEALFYLKQTIPHPWLFPSLSAAIHHGGAGTTHIGLQYGLPTLLVPFGADQPFNADRVWLNRVGPQSIPARQITSRNLTHAIDDLLDNYTLYQTNAQRMALAMKEEKGVEHCIQMIERELSLE